MSSENSTNNFYKGIVAIGLLIILSIVEWIKEHPFTTAWLLAAVAFGAYAFFSSRDGDGPGSTPPPSPF